MKPNTQPRYFYAFDIAVNASIGHSVEEIEYNTANRIAVELRNYFKQHDELIKRTRVRKLGQSSRDVISHHLIIETIMQMEPWLFNLFRVAANVELSDISIYESLTYFNYEDDTVFVRHPSTHPLTNAKRNVIRSVILGPDRTFIERLCFRPRFVENAYSTISSSTMPNYILSGISAQANKDANDWYKHCIASKPVFEYEHNQVTYVPEMVYHNANGAPALAMDSYELRPETGRDSYTVCNGVVSMVTDVHRGRAGFICVDTLQSGETEKEREVPVKLSAVESDVLSVMESSDRESWLKLNSLTFDDGKLTKNISWVEPTTRRSSGVVLGHTGLLGPMGYHIHCCMDSVQHTLNEKPRYDVVNVVLNYAGTHVFMRSEGYTHVISLLNFKQVFADDYVASDECKEISRIYDHFHERYRDEMLDGTQSNKHGVEINAVFEDTTYRWWFVAPCEVNSFNITSD